MNHLMQSGGTPFLRQAIAESSMKGPGPTPEHGLAWPVQRRKLSTSLVCT